MTMFGPERIANFMKNQPVAAAKRIIDNCKDYTEESVTLALLGPAKGLLIQDEQTMGTAHNLFGERTVELMKYLAGMSAVKFDPDMPKDATRLFLVEGLSSMNDQLIGRAKIDAHHQVRWNMLENFEKQFATLKGENPGIDELFVEALVKSRDALEALDKAQSNARPKKPGFGP
jgi:hypothetical protein